MKFPRRGRLEQLAPLVGQIVTSNGARCYSKEGVERKASVTRTCHYINWTIHTYTYYTQCIKLLLFYQRGLTPRILI